jgi:hypothetical protein
MGLISRIYFLVKFTTPTFEAKFDRNDDSDHSEDHYKYDQEQ